MADPQQQDWFAANAPKTAQAAGGGDWFAANAPEQQQSQAPQPGYLDKEIPLTSYGAATEQGFQTVGRGVRDAVTGIGQMIAHPIDTIKGIGQLPAQAAQVPGAISDINQSADPAGTYAKVAQDTAGQGAGQALTALATTGIAKGAGAAVRAIPSIDRAVQNFSEVKAAVGSTPIDVTDVGNQALKIYDLSKQGGSLPKVVKDFLNRVADPSKPPITYSEAREFYSNATGRLSPDQAMKLTPRGRFELAKFTQALRGSLEDTAGQAGKAEQFNAAMSEYAKAAGLRDTIQSAKDLVTSEAAKGVAKGLGVGAGGYAAYKIFKP